MRGRAPDRKGAARHAVQGQCRPPAPHSQEAPSGHELGNIRCEPACPGQHDRVVYGRGDRGLEAEHLSVYQTSPELWEREAFEEQLDGAPEATGEPGKSSAGELGRLAVRAFFSAGAGLLAWSHIPVETAQ
jgi:hypothetical protein